ncbi:hypothetical protein IFM89_002094 [Coptis chinensis]|uniref:SKP1 component dimerisation domain-containing protein n=1 Tax=Coptis chinensis TaxID=261450 RepID=A0A835H2N4_9MAGN|nr:hypothetical protein IFM89_002094 [Coptis chinensis]
MAGAFLSSIPSISKPLPKLFHNSHFTPTIFPKTQSQNLKTPRRFVVFAEGNNGINKDEKEINNKEEDMKKDERVTINFSWRDFLNPDPENIVAVGLTGYGGSGSGGGGNDGGGDSGGSGGGGGGGLVVVVVVVMARAANYLNIKSLVDLVVQTFSYMMKGKTPAEIYSTFNINDVFPPVQVKENRSTWTVLFK